MKILRSPYINWIVIITMALLWRQFGPGFPTETVRTSNQIAEVFAAKRSDLMVEFEAKVLRVLDEQPEATSYQRFIVELDNGHTLLVAQNLKQSSRAPLEKWDQVKVRGEYTWHEHGGIVDWTHRDPGAGIKHGWIEHRGNRYD